MADYNMVHFGSPVGTKYEPITGKPTEPKKPQDPGPQPVPEPAPVLPPKTRWWKR